ncbi:MAG TPA: SIS domain-containing protein [Actinomycetes bacterium]|jgi:glucosamine--fructose-6-phosphate aminotransferase (isomerizing)|nr:SIS domain-containing protein [Actinomycetes bacterium]
MCGIIAVVRRPSDRPVPDARGIVAGLEQARGLLPDTPVDQGEPGRLERAAERLDEADGLLRGLPGLRCLLADGACRRELDTLAAELERRLERLEASIDTGPASVPREALEAVNAALVRAKDSLWAIRCDRIASAEAVAAFTGPDPSPAAVETFASIQIALAALDRLEVRGRDSAGLHVLVAGHGLDLNDPDLVRLLEPRLRDPLFTSGAMRTPAGHLSFVYKAAGEVGELGDNGRRLRAAIAGDELLRCALRAEGARALVLAHTRWASVGLINQANAHPLNQEEEGNAARPAAVAALNGDIDNHLELLEERKLHIPSEITTDAKVIPVLLARRLDEGLEPHEAFRRTVVEFEGSFAIAAQTAAVPGQLLLGVRGSGQGLYVGLAEDAFLVASEPYGLVAETSRYLRMDGEATAVDADGGAGVKGQIVVLDQTGAGTLEGIRRLDYQGGELPVGEEDLRQAEITTRDIDRGPFPHYLLKEISEAPSSFRKTLRGRIRERDGRRVTNLGPEALPAELHERLGRGEVQRVFVIGQGTAAIAGRGVAAAMAAALRGAQLRIAALPATELSGFGLQARMDDALVVAISQSGTTTDTNRTVDLLRARGAAVIAIVNRRSSDLTHKADGVLYTSDGRDVEMSVASTKAFYAQVAAGTLLAFAIAEAMGRADAGLEDEVLGALRELPTAMTRVLAQRDRIRELARRYAPARRHWAVVGNGRNQIAAEEIRIKLSELCYKSIACDATEDKKHIDLSSEPLTLVCAAGLGGSAAGDVAKEVAIFRAHAGVPIVIATEGEARFERAAGVVSVPPAHPALAYVLSTMAGHLFGYEAALAIDAQALPLRRAREAIEQATAAAESADEALERLGPALAPIAAELRGRVRAGEYDGTLDAGTALRVTSLLRYADGLSPLDAYQLEHGRVATPSVLLDDLTAALTAGIDQLTRPVDAIKHQAKTVTVGISRSDEALLTVPLVRHLLEAGAAREQLAYGSLRTVAELDPAVGRVTGFTRYRVAGDPAAEAATIEVADRGGISLTLASRTERDRRLRGTKQRVAAERQVLAARGRSDGRTVVLVPEVKDDHVTGLVLLHVELRERLPAARMRRVLEGYRGRLAELRSAVTETEPAFDESLLGELPVARLLTEPVEVLADHWTGR